MTIDLGGGGETGSDVLSDGAGGGTLPPRIDDLDEEETLRRRRLDDALRSVRDRLAEARSTTAARLDELGEDVRAVEAAAAALLAPMAVETEEEAEEEAWEDAREKDEEVKHDNGDDKNEGDDEDKHNGGKNMEEEAHGVDLSGAKEGEVAFRDEEGGTSPGETSEGEPASVSATPGGVLRSKKKRRWRGKRSRARKNKKKNQIAAEAEPTESSGRGAVRGKLVKAAAGALLLASATLGQGPSLLRKTGTVGRAAVGETPSGGRILQGATSVALPYYAVGDFCDNDASKAPGPDDGAALYETAEECCEAVASGLGEWLKAFCVLMTPSPPQTIVTGAQPIFSPTASLLPTSTPVLQDVPDGPDTMAPNDAAEPGDSAAPASDLVSTRLTFLPTAGPSTLAPNNANGNSEAPASGALVSTTLPPSLSSIACDPNPETCGCPDARMTDYRGSIDTTETGESCLMWREDLVKDYPDAGLEGHNFCRNPTPDIYDRAWCLTATTNPNWGHCDVPVCGAPTATPTTSPRPSSSLRPSESPSTSALPSSSACVPDPETCGCPDARMTDYRGSIDTTETGESCRMWGERHHHTSVKDDPDLQGHNFCRNPNNVQDRAWCMTGPYHWNYCDVPVCGAPTSSPTTSPRPSSSLRPSGQPTPAPTGIACDPDPEICGCPDVLMTDYRGSINTTATGKSCLMWGEDSVKNFPDAGLEGHNFCRNPSPDDDDRAWCWSTDPDGWEYCDVPVCCDKGDSTCRCRDLKELCRKSIETNRTDFCRDAEAECCKDNEDPTCRCGMYEGICSQFPSQHSCEFAAVTCCESYSSYSWTFDNCFCDFHTYRDALLGETDSISPHCALAKNLPSAFYGLQSLENLYMVTGGEHWYNNSGWLDQTTSYCQWFGLTCNEAGFPKEINLRDNNLTGFMPHVEWGWLVQEIPEVGVIDLSMNKLSGEIRGPDTISLRKLSYIDISQNELSGHADMIFSPVISHVNFSHNHFTSVRFYRFNPTQGASDTVFDLSNNQIQGDVSSILANIPRQVKELILSNNALRGTFPDPFPVFESMTRFAMDRNSLNGPLPDSFASATRLKELDLSNQDREHMDKGGLTGTIPTTLSKLDDLLMLNLAGNKLRGGIPSDIGNFKQINFVNLSSNELSQSIPSEVGRLQGVLDVLDLSMNHLTGKIPSELGTFVETSVYFEANENLSSPAPLSLCFMPGFDLLSIAKYCPPERNALKVFYDFAGGGEWIANGNWADEYESHCSWYGVTCDDNNRTINLELESNALSGKLVENISELSSLRHLNLGDNDLKGTIPTSIGLLSNLTFLRLSYNGFVGNETNFGSNLPHLSLLQLHGNRLEGTIPLLNLPFPEKYSFISDCGNPSDFDKSLECLECTMCCNSQGDCYPNEEFDIIGFKSYLQLTEFFFACLAGTSCVIALAAYGANKYTNHRYNRSRSFVHRESHEMSTRDEEYALDTLGEGSLYQFFLGTSLWGWLIVLATMGVQMWLLFVFVEGAEIDVTDDKVDFVYSYQCPRDGVECDDKSDLSLQGWISFGILMAAHLSKDIISGIKLLLLSGKQRHSHNKRARLFVSGLLLFLITAFTLYVSTLYNMAIATSNTEIIMNSVIILFIMDVDELIYEILVVCNPAWVKSLGPQQEGSRGDASLEGEIQSLKELVQKLSSDVNNLQNENKALRRLIGKPQDG